MKQSKTRRLAAGILAVAIAVGLPLGGAWAAHRSEAEQAIAAAQTAHKEAAAAGVAAQETADLIEQAQGLIPSRQYTKAIELAQKAEKQDRHALKVAAAKGSAAPGPAHTDADAAAEQAIADAEAARKKAAAAGGEWRDTEKMVKEAQDLVKAGEPDKAIKLANKAKRQGELGYAQALAEKDAGFPSYMLKKQ